MAFELPALPNFNVQVPDLTQKALEGAQLRNMMSEMALRQALAPLQVQQAQQQVQASQTENEMKQMTLQGQRAMTDWLQNGDVNAEVPAEKFSSNDKIATFVGVTPSDPIMSVIRSMAQHHVPAPMLVTEAQGMLQRRNEYFKGTKEEQDAQKAERLIWQDALASLHEAPADQRSALLAAKLPLLQENSKTDPLLGTYAQGLAGHPELIDQAYNTLSAENAALGLRKTKEEVAKTTAEAAKAQTEATEAAAEATGAVTPKMATEQQQKLALTRAEATAREQVQASMLPLMEQIRQQFGNQKDARDKIDTQVLKPYQEKMTDITMARNAIAQAADNPVAARAAVFKMVGVAQPSGSHRVLPMEFQAFKYPGGITDQVRERFNNFLTGEPWTPEIAQAANAFIDSQDAAAKARLNGGIDEQNALFGTTVGAGLKQTVPTVKTPGATGQLPQSLTAAQITAYANAHHISEAAVKEQAKAQGIKVPD